MARPVRVTDYTTRNATGSPANRFGSGFAYSDVAASRTQPGSVPGGIPLATSVNQEGTPVFCEADMNERPSRRRLVYFAAVLAPAVTLLVRWPLELVLGDKVLY